MVYTRGSKTAAKMPETALIIGDQSAHGEEFILLALQDYPQVVLVSHQGNYINKWKRRYPQQIQGIQTHFSQEGIAKYLSDQVVLLAEKAMEDYRIKLVVNLIEFREFDPMGDWENHSQNPSLDIPQLLEWNERFIRTMNRQGEGEILNIISRPADCDEMVVEMFQHTQLMLIEVAEKINEMILDSQVHVHTMSYSPQSFVLQTTQLPAQLAHDMIPKSFSAKEIADYGYQVVQVQRGNS